ncbi:MAG: hypothetical protein WCI88_01205 [Chloroflexota bacterium]
MPDFLIPLFPLLPVFSITILGTASISLLILARFFPTFRYSWFVAIFGTLLAWFLLLITTLRLPLVIPVPFSSSDRIFINTSLLVVDEISWFYAAALLTLLLAVLTTDIIRTQDTHPAIWAGEMMITAAGMLAVFAADPPTMVMGWAVLGVLETIILFTSSQSEESRKRIILSFTFHALGIFLAILGIANYQISGVDLGMMDLYPGINLYILAAAALRLGIYPLYNPTLQDESLKRRSNTMIRSVSAAASFVVLARLAQTSLPDEIKPLLLACFAIIALIGTIKWANAADEIDGQPYLILGITSFCYAAVILSQPWACVAWSLALFLSAGLLFLSPNRQKHWYWLPLLGTVLFSGLPFSPLWGGLRIYQKSFLSIYPQMGIKAVLFGSYALFLVAHAFILAGFVRHALTRYPESEKAILWAKGINLAGILILPVTQIAFGIWIGLKYARANLWLGALTVCLATLIFLTPFFRLLYTELASRWKLRFPGSVETETPLQQESIFARFSKILHWIRQLFSLKWLYSFFNKVFSFIERIFLLANRALEGEGGIMWSILIFMFLLAVIFRSE